MSPPKALHPVVLSIGGLEPTGAGGLLADSQVVASMGAQATGVVAAVKLHDEHGNSTCNALPATDLAAQARAVLAAGPVAAVKLGALGSHANAEAVSTLLGEAPGLPAVLHAGALCRMLPRDEELLDAAAALLCPHVTVLVARATDARALAPEADSGAAAAQQLMSYGCEYVLLSGADQPGGTVVNHWYGHKDHIESFQWERLPGTFSGAGSTLTAAIAALLAHGVDAFTAVHEAQEYVLESLRNARRDVQGALLPEPMFWAHEDDEDADA